MTLIEALLTGLLHTITPEPELPPKTITVCKKLEYGKICEKKDNPEYKKIMELVEKYKKEHPDDNLR